VYTAYGLEYEVYGPVSVRHNDNYTLANSQIEAKLEQAQLQKELKYKIFGDSAYSVSEWIKSGGGRGMSSVRESIEWKYKDIKTTWKYCDYRHALKLMNQPVAKVFFVCMLLTNAYVCLNGNQTSEHFLLEPPTLDDWLSQGPRYRENVFAEPI
jgi:hypothetical protein